MKAVVEGNLKIDSVLEILRKRNLESGGMVQKFVASEVVRLCRPYLPFDNGTLDRSAVIAIDGKEVHYTAPYARRWYYNEALTDALGRKYGPAKFQGAPQRGSHWFPRMMNEGGREAILNGAAQLSGLRSKT